MQINIRWMLRSDLTAVVSMERELFEFPWAQIDFANYLRNRGCMGMVATDRDGSVVGYMVYEVHENRIHLLNIAARPGVGGMLMTVVLGKLDDRRGRVMLEVRETNLKAQRFFQRWGFKAISILRDFYEDSEEDAYLMQYVAPSKVPA